MKMPFGCEQVKWGRREYASGGRAKQSATYRQSSKGTSFHIRYDGKYWPYCMAKNARAKESVMATGAASKPSPEIIFSTLIAYQNAFTLKAAIELDLFTAIAEGASDAAALAKRVQASERGVRILADGLTVQGFLRKEKGEYLLTPESALFLDKRSPAYMGGMAEFLTNEENISNFSRFADSVR